MIIDCVMASYETDALAVRDAELSGIVDLRVIVQGTETFRGEPLTLIEDPPGTTPTRMHYYDFAGETDPWKREYALRQYALDMGHDVEEDEAWLILSDADEIPHPQAIAHVAGPSLLPVDMREWYMDWRVPDSWQPPHQPLMGQYAHYQEAGGAQAARAAYDWTRMIHRGWHLSTLGDAALASVKLSAFAHEEYDTEAHNDPEILEARRTGRRDILDRFALEPALDLPGCADRFPHLLAPA